MKPEFILFLTLYLLCLTTRTTYELLKKSGRANSKSKILFFVIFAAMCLLWICWFAMCPLDPWRLDLPDPLRWIAFGIFVVGWGLALGALFQLRGLENIDHLITSGLFSIIRHPMYAGFMLWIIGWSFYHCAAASFLVGLFGIGNVLYWRHLEDAALELRYGDRYREYRKGTWF